MGALLISRFSTSSQSNRLARSRSIQETQKSFGSAPAKPGRATALQSATESINQRTAAKTGPIWVSGILNALQRFLSIQILMTQFMFARPENYGATAMSAAFTRRLTLERHGPGFSPEQISRPAVP